MDRERIFIQDLDDVAFAASERLSVKYTHDMTRSLLRKGAHHLVRHGMKKNTILPDLLVTRGTRDAIDVWVRVGTLSRREVRKDLEVEEGES